MWVVADLDDEYIAKMEDVLGVYEQPYNAQEPVICIDEKPITLHADLRPVWPAVPGREARRDNEYERRGTANVFCAVEPKAGRHFTFATPDSLGLRVGSSCRDASHGIPGGGNDPSGTGQSEHPSPQSVGGCLWRGNGSRSVEPLHRPLHAHSRQLAQSGRDRNRDLLAAMPGASTHP